MSSDMHDLLSRMADELDNYRQLLTDDRREVHALATEARAALAAAPEGEPSDQEIADVFSQGCRDLSRSYEPPFLGGARAILARWGRPAAPLEGEVGELVAELRDAAFDLNGSDPAKSMLTRAADLLEQLAAAAPAVVPVPVSEALIKAECALSDVAEGEPECDDGDPAQWAEQRCAETLAVIRPVMKQHKIRTSEWPPLPAPQGGEGEA